MPTNANTFNSRVTSEALEAKFRQVFPAQGGAELVQDLFASGVIQPVVDFSTVAEGSVLPQQLQEAWDFATDAVVWINGTSGTLINNPGFWLVDVTCGFEAVTGSNGNVSQIELSDGLSTKIVWNMGLAAGSSFQDSGVAAVEQKFVVFLRSGDSLTYQASNGFNSRTSAWFRQVADVNGTLVNPLGFTFS